MMRQREKGFTLIEIIVTVAILGIIVPALTMTTATLVTKQQLVNDHNIVLQQLQNTAFWISHDVQSAENVTLTEPGGFPLSMVIPVDTNESNNYSIDYVFVDNKLKRKVYDSTHTLTGETLVAEYIDAADTTFGTIEANYYAINIRATKGKAEAERNYRISQRLVHP